MAEILTNQMLELEEVNRKLLEEIEEKQNKQVSEQGIREVLNEFEKVRKALMQALIKRIEISKDRKKLESIEFWFLPDYSLPLGEIRGTVS